MNHWMEELERLYQDAVEKIQAAAKSRKFGEGFLGFGRKLSDEPCHMELYHGVKKVTEEMKDRVAPEEAARVIRFIFERPGIYRKLDHSMYWTMLVIHGHALELIPCLEPEQAQELYAFYDKAFPKRIRVPIQDQIVKALLNKM